MNSYSKLHVTLMLSIFLLLTPILLVNAQSENTSSTAISQAEQALSSTHEAILEAEQAGANVSSLLDKSNIASEYLAESHVWYRLGAFDKASQSADLCFDAIKGTMTEAFELKDEAEKQSEADRMADILLSVAGVVIVLVSCFVAWLVFTRNYQRNKV